MEAKKKPALLLGAAMLIAMVCAMANYSGPIVYVACSLIAGSLQEICR